VTRMLRKIAKKHLPSGMQQALAMLLSEYRVWRLHRGSLEAAKKMSLSNGFKINVGCGRNLKPGWINIDLCAVADLHLDLREDLPFANDSASCIYSEHFFEHLEYPGEALHFLAESYRTLAPGGKFVVGVPDTEWPLSSYVAADPEYFHIAADKRWHPAWCNTRLHHINYHFRQGSEHKYAYDFETLKLVLEEAGFVHIVRREFDPSQDTEARKLGTLYVEAEKPTAN
jgi:predicted SAM-dependent methyltransferase